MVEAWLRPTREAISINENNLDLAAQVVRFVGWSNARVLDGGGLRMEGLGERLLGHGQLQHRREVGELGIDLRQ